MRGPSSSHCAAALRIGRLCRDFVQAKFEDILIEFDINGSLATTHKSQGSDMGLFGGFLGWEPHDERLPTYESFVAQMGWHIHIKKHDFGAEHPNTYRMTFKHHGLTQTLTAISTGGGMIEIIEIEGAPVSFFGDTWVMLIYGEDLEETKEFVSSIIPDSVISAHLGIHRFLAVKIYDEVKAQVLAEIRQHQNIDQVCILNPVLPILSSADETVPFTTAAEMRTYAQAHHLEIWQAALHYESKRGNISETQVMEKMRDLYQIMRQSVEDGLAGTSYADRILGPQSLQFKEKMSSGDLVKGDVLNMIIMYVSAIMENKSAMGVIVAAPTAGACGALPGAIIGAADALDIDQETVIKGMLAAGIVGVFIAEQASFAAEVGGCQAECGSGSCMAAAGLVTMMGGDLEQSLTAASLALQNSLGMICDPIANRVEAPCLGKNVMAASNALSCTNMALANYQHLIPLDQVIQTMAKVSEQMARELRCTALGGLSVTAAAKEIEKKLGNQEDLATAAQKFKIC